MGTTHGRLVAWGVLGLAIAGCVAPPPDTVSLAGGAPAALRLAEAESGAERRQVLIHFQDAAQLERIAGLGVDLFENVDIDRKTVGATVTSRTAPKLAALGVAVDYTNAEATGGFPAGYHTVAQIYADMRALAAKYPAIVQVVAFGQSLETSQGRARRPMLALRVTSKRDAGLPAIRLGSGFHARELPPVELTTRFAHALAEGYGRDATLTRLVDTREIWIVPLQNPDGRAKVEAGNVMWRKNARRDGAAPQGVDCNRNADVAFARGDADKWADDFKGPSPFSEPETRALRDLAIERRFDVSLDIHCYGGMVLWPPGYDTSYTADEAEYRRVGGALGTRLGYRAGTIARTIYPAFGDMTTWEYTTQKTLSFAAELDSGAFNPAYGEVERQWGKWKGALTYLVGETKHRAR